MITDKVLSLSIHRQIQIGIFCISFFIFFMVFLLISLTSFILLNQLYYNQKTHADTKENQYIEAVGTVFDSDTKISKVIRGDFFVNLRLLTENHKEYKK